MKVPVMSRKFEIRGIPEGLPEGLHHLRMGIPEVIDGQEIVPLHYSHSPTKCLLTMQVGN